MTALLCGVRAGSGDDLDPAAGRLDRQADHFQVFVVVERGGFARGADRDDPVDLARDLKVDEPGVGCRVDAPVPKRGDKRRVSAAKIGPGVIRRHIKN